MKSKLMKKTLVAFALASLGLVATGAQADGVRDAYSHGHNPVQGWSGNHNAYNNSGRIAFQQSEKFSQQVNARQNRQMERIQAGMRSGALTRNEFRELMREQQEIRSMEQRFKADGMIDAREFQRLDRALDMASRNILDEKHDRQARNANNQHSRYN